jgi:hypothetical protein
MTPVKNGLVTSVPIDLPAANRAATPGGEAIGSDCSHEIICPCVDVTYLSATVNRKYDFLPCQAQFISDRLLAIEQCGAGERATSGAPMIGVFYWSATFRAS